MDFVAVDFLSRSFPFLFITLDVAGI